MKNIKFITIVLVLFLLSSCKKEYDLPPSNPLPANSGPITIDSIKKTYLKHYLNTIPQPTVMFRFNTDINLTCTVTADEVSGNIYKGVYVSDATGALSVKLLNSGGLFVGDQIRINLNGVLLSDYGSMIQLDSIDIEKRVVKLSSGNPVVPTKMTFNQIFELNGSGILKNQSRLVLLDSVEFVAGNKGLTFADAVNKYSLDRMLQSQNSNQTAIVRTSGYSNFAASTIPCGKGSMVAIVGQYNSDLQLTIPNFFDVKLSNDGCPLLVKSFDSPSDPSLTFGGWSNYNVTGSINFVTSSYNGQSFAKISNYSNFTNNACETWFISPAFDISGAGNPNVSFISAYNFTGPAIQLLVSTNYSSGNPNSATWTVLNPTLPLVSGYVWTKSGKVSLANHKSSGTRIAFKYTGTGSSGSTWEIDDIAVFAD